jgi:hypothetical protein
MWKHCTGTLSEYFTFPFQPHTTSSVFESSIIYHRRYINFRSVLYAQNQRKNLYKLEVLEVFSLNCGQLYFESRCLTKCKPVHGLALINKSKTPTLQTNVFTATNYKHWSQLCPYALTGGAGLVTNDCCWIQRIPEGLSQEMNAAVGD